MSPSPVIVLTPVSGDAASRVHPTAHQVRLKAALVETGWWNAAQLVARGDVELAEDLVQVVLDRSGADEQLGADSGVGEAVAGESGDLSLLGCEDVARVHGTPAGGLAGSQELAFGALRRRLGTNAAEGVVGGSKLLPSVRAAVLATQPFAVHELAASEMNGDPAAAESRDRLAVKKLASFPVGEKRL